MDSRLIERLQVVDGERLDEKRKQLAPRRLREVHPLCADILFDSAELGVFGFITNHGYLDNPTFRGMRQVCMRDVSSTAILDLHGNSKKRSNARMARRTRTCSTFSKALRSACSATRQQRPRIAHRTPNCGGHANAKYAWLLDSVELERLANRLMPDSPYYFFVPQDDGTRAMNTSSLENQRSVCHDSVRGHSITARRPVRRSTSTSETRLAAHVQIFSELEHRAMPGSSVAATTRRQLDVELRRGASGIRAQDATDEQDRSVHVFIGHSIIAHDVTTTRTLLFDMPRPSDAHICSMARIWRSYRLGKSTSRAIGIMFCVAEHPVEIKTAAALRGNYRLPALSTIGRC